MHVESSSHFFLHSCKEVPWFRILAWKNIDCLYQQYDDFFLVQPNFWRNSGRQMWSTLRKENNFWLQSTVEWFLTAVLAIRRGSGVNAIAQDFDTFAGSFIPVPVPTFTKPILVTHKCMYKLYVRSTAKNIPFASVCQIAFGTEPSLVTH